MRAAAVALALGAAAAVGGAETGAWDFAPGTDEFKPDALLDLRHLNEAQAGAAGFVRRSGDGNGFVRGDGQPLRFWGTLLRIDSSDWPDAQLDRHYRLLAKRGVNLVRLFGQLAVQTDGAKLEDVNEEQISRFHRHVAAAKRAGVYAMIAPYWSVGKVPASWGLPTEDLHGLPFVSDRFRAAWLGWMRELMTRPNPHLAGVPLKDEPAVAVVQLHNEDSLLFYTSQGYCAEWKAVLRKAFAAWAAKRHGSAAQALASWDGAAAEGDAPAAGELGLHIVWQFTQPHQGGMAKRLADQLEFMATHQRDTYAGMVDGLKKTLGCRQLVNVGNWKTVDEALVGDVERWTYQAGDVMALNRYVSAAHLGEHCGWRVDAGHAVADLSVLSSPEAMPFGIRQPVGHPFVVTESAWTFPNRHLGEGPFVTAVFGSLAGVDGAVWSMVSAPEWQLEISMPWTRSQPNASLVKWMVDIPACLGGFPAHALAFRRGDIATPAPAVHEARRPEDLWQRQPAGVVEGRGYDPNVADAGAVTAQTPRDTRAFLTGPVTVSFDGSAPKAAGPAMTKAAKPAAKAPAAAAAPSATTVTSLGGEVETDLRAGVARVRTPRFIGVCGKLRDAGGTFSLGKDEIRCGNEIAAVSAVALDGEPIAKSRSVLLQVTTEAWPTGWRTEPLPEGDDGRKSGATSRVAATGGGPWRIASSDVSVALANPALTEAVVLDVDGYAAGSVPVTRDAAGRATITVPPTAMYVVLRAATAARPAPAER